MASWTRSALALMTSTPGIQALVEAAYPDAGRIAACHVIAWSRLCKQWTRTATHQAQSLSRADRKMIELSAEGLHVAGHHVSHWMSRTSEWLIPPKHMHICADPKPLPSTPGKAAPITAFTINDFVMWDVDEIHEQWAIESGPARLPIGPHMSVPCQKLWPSIPKVLVLKVCGAMLAWPSACAILPPTPSPMCGIM